MIDQQNNPITDYINPKINSKQSNNQINLTKFNNQSKTVTNCYISRRYQSDTIEQSNQLKHSKSIEANQTNDVRLTNIIEHQSKFTKINSLFRLF